MVATWDGEVAGEVPAGDDGVLLGVLAGAVPAGAEDEELPVGYGGTTAELGALGEVDGPVVEATCEGED